MARANLETPARNARPFLTALWVGSLVVAFQIGSWRGGAGRQPPLATLEAAREVTAPAPAPDGTAPSTRAFGEADVRRWIAEAVRAQAEVSCARASAPAPPAPERVAAPGGSAEPDFDPIATDATFTRGEDLLQAARARRQWTPDDAAQLRGLMPQLPAEQRHALADALFAALADDRLRSEVPGAPL